MLAFSFALQLDHHADAVAVGLVAQIADPLDALVAHQVGDLLDQLGLVDLVRQLGDHQHLAILASRVVLDLDDTAHPQPAATGGVGLTDPHQPVDHAGGREVRAGDALHQLVERALGVVDDQLDAVDHLAQVVRRDVGRHADRDARRAVDQQVRVGRGEDRGLLLGAVVGRHEIDGVLVDVLEQLGRQTRQLDLGVTHRRRRVAVDRAEVALAVDQGMAHRERLGQSHDRVVDRRLTVGVVAADHGTDGAGRLAVRLVRLVAGDVHAVQRPAMHRLEAVADVGQRAPDDHAHRVVEIRVPHLVLDADRCAVVSCLFVSHQVLRGTAPLANSEGSV